MIERVKVFTSFSGHGATVIETPFEDTINHWLAGVEGQVLQVSQSESERAGGGHHLTVCIWYIPAELADQQERTLPMT